MSIFSNGTTAERLSKSLCEPSRKREGKEEEGEGERKDVPSSPSIRNDAVYTPGVHLHAEVCEKNQSFGVHSSGFHPAPSDNCLKHLLFPTLHFGFLICNLRDWARAAVFNLQDLIHS